jgi:O-antigen ligase
VTRLTSFLFLASVFCVTFEKVHWNVAGSVSLADVLALLFIGAFVIGTRKPVVPKTTAILLGFFAAFALVYLLGYFDLSDSDALAQWAKGFTKWAIHFAFLAAAVVWLSRRGRAYFWKTLAFFSAGMVVNAAYGLLQLLDARRGGNLDASILSPITGGASQINVYGAIAGANVYRPNALTGDPNHLGIMLIVPLLVLTPLYLRLERGHRLRPWLMATIGFLLFVEAATLSRSGLLGLLVGALVLAVPYRRYLLTPQLLVPIGAACTVLLAIVLSRRSFFTTILRSRVQTSGGSENAHFQVYSFIPHVLHADPLFGLGLNTFSVYYEFVTGKTNWGPHSYYVALLVETGLVGTALFALFLVWVFKRLARARALGRSLAAARDPLAARVRPLAWGCTAALCGTLASNAFYLTMQFYYFYAFVALALSIPVVFARAE